MPDDLNEWQRRCKMLYSIAVAFEHGQVDCSDGKPFLANPYPRKTELWAAWRIGYLTMLDARGG